jgi:hypothetical protein
MNKTVRGIGIRLVVLLIGLVLLAGWVIGLVMDIAGAAIHFVLVLALVLIAGGFVMHKWRGMRRS